MPKVLVLAAPGFETIELATPVDLLRRAGVEVVIAAVDASGTEVTSAQNITITADAELKDVKGQPFDAVVAPGGIIGTTNLAKNKDVIELIKKQNSDGKVIGAICAVPGFVLAEAAGILKGKKATGYPGTEEKITANGGILVQEGGCVVDGNIVTSKGPGTSVCFGLTLIKVLVNEAKATEVAEKALIKKN
uniref:DJ-1 family protein n=1 Tax=Coptotermes formosanus TaxID=36987 RepID=R4UW25_COPFO|nr:DJ-1 family protein [Coptotermes formosanus]